MKFFGPFSILLVSWFTQDHVSCQALRGAAVTRKLTANPTSVNCVNNGGEEETHYEGGYGEYTVCRFTDGSACEEWAFFSGNCKKGSLPHFVKYCKEESGTVERNPVDWGNMQGEPPANYRVCNFSDGSWCDEFSYYKGGCDKENESGMGNGMGNPAPSNCIDNGGEEETRYDEDGGQYGVCRFPDGSACEEWAYLNKQCKEGSMPHFVKYCKNQSGTVERNHVDWGNVEGAPAANYRVCMFGDGSECDESSYYQGEC